MSTKGFLLEVFRSKETGWEAYRTYNADKVSRARMDRDRLHFQRIGVKARVQSLFVRPNKGRPRVAKDQATFPELGELGKRGPWKHRDVTGGGA